MEVSFSLNVNELNKSGEQSMFAYVHLPKQRITKYKRTTKKVTRTTKTFRPTNPVRATRPILTPYGQFLAEFATHYNAAESAIRPYSSDSLYADASEERRASLETKLFFNEVNHQRYNYAESLRVFEIIRQLTAQATRAIKAVEAENGKNGGAANKRRSRAIKQFKSVKSDFSLLLNSSRSAIGSTQVARRSIQDTIDDEVKYVEKQNGLVTYKSQSYREDLKSIEIILNSDIIYAYKVYRAVTAALPQFNKLVAKFNLTMRQV